MTDGVNAAASVCSEDTDGTADYGSTTAALKAAADRYGSQRALTFFLDAERHRRPKTWTFADNWSCIARAANLFRDLGIGRDDVVAYILPNLPETLWSIWGGEAAGRVLAINPLLDAASIAELLAEARTKWVVTLANAPGTDIWSKVSEAVGNQPSLKGLLTVDPAVHMSGPKGVVARSIIAARTPGKINKLPVLSFGRELRRMNDAIDFPLPQQDDTASYFCTGGTTGRSKIAIRSHRCEMSNVSQLKAALGHTIGAGTNLFCGLPLFHVNAQTATALTCWTSGANLVLGTPQGYRGPGVLDRFWEIVDHHAINVISAVPTVYSRLLSQPVEGHDIDCLDVAICGAAPMPPSIIARFEELTGARIAEGYGLTEGGCVSSLNPTNGTAKAGSIGKAVPGQSMRIAILDERANWVRDAEVDEIGSILISGPNLFDGYLRATDNEGVWVKGIEASGASKRWLNTGDLGRCDPDGFFWITGRRKELIIRGGHNIDPGTIEDAMCTHADVALAAAIGRPDVDVGEVPVVYVQAAEGAVPDLGALREHAEKAIGERAAVPREIIVVDELPLTAVGKVFKPDLVHREIDGVVRGLAAETGVVVDRVDVDGDPRHGRIVRIATTAAGPAFLEQLDLLPFAVDVQTHGEVTSIDGPILAGA